MCLRARNSGVRRRAIPDQKNGDPDVRPEGAGAAVLGVRASERRDHNRRIVTRRCEFSAVACGLGGANAIVALVSSGSGATLRLGRREKAGPLMSDADDYRARSAQCFRLAETATSPLQRQAMLDAATHWMTLANQVDCDRARRVQQHANPETEHRAVG